MYLDKIARPNGKPTSNLQAKCSHVVLLKTTLEASFEHLVSLLVFPDTKSDVVFEVVICATCHLVIRFVSGGGSRFLPMIFMSMARSREILLLSAQKDD